ncbi:MAG: MarC family protein [Bacteroidales bacterium]|nr:MarC family protein [Bacteroidales bacterium]
MFNKIDFLQILSAFMVLFAIIDITGSIPIIINMKNKGKEIHPWRVSIISFFVLIIFLIAGEGLLKLFHVDISSFAIAGALIIFVLAAEMIFDVEIFKTQGPTESATIVPLVFPLIAGTGTITTLLSLRAEYHMINIIIALGLNMVYVWIVLRYVSVVERVLGKSGIYILRKFFGIILLAIAVKLFSNNLNILIQSMR